MIFLRFDKDGRYVEKVVAAPESIQYEDQDRIFIGDADPQTQYHNFETGLPVDMPPKPSDFHAFDFVAKSWYVDTVEAWFSIRIKRAALLKGCDWTVLRDYEAGREPATEWVAYRQALRDITLQTDPTAIIWPTLPQ